MTLRTSDEIRTLVVRFRCKRCGKVTSGREPKTGNPNIDNAFMYPRLHRVGGMVCGGSHEFAEYVDVDSDTGALA